MKWAVRVLPHPFTNSDYVAYTTNWWILAQCFAIALLVFHPVAQTRICRGSACL